MPIRVACPACSKRFQAPDSAAGRRGKCPTCGAMVEVPAVVASGVGRRREASSNTEEGFPRFDASDFELPPLPKRSDFESSAESSATPLSDLYATPSGPAMSPTRRRASARTRGRYERAATMLVLLDWINRLGVALVVTLAIGATVASTGENSELATARPLLWSLAGAAVAAYPAIFISITATLALLDIEEHLASGKR